MRVRPAPPRLCRPARSVVCKAMEIDLRTVAMSLPAQVCKCPCEIHQGRYISLQSWVALSHRALGLRRSSGRGQWVSNPSRVNGREAIPYLLSHTQFGDGWIRTGCRGAWGEGGVGSLLLCNRQLWERDQEVPSQSINQLINKCNAKLGWSLRVRASLVLTLVGELWEVDRLFPEGSKTNVWVQLGQGTWMGCERTNTQGGQRLRATVSTVAGVLGLCPRLPPKPSPPWVQLHF